MEKKTPLRYANYLLSVMWGQTQIHLILAQNIVECCKNAKLAAIPNYNKKLKN
jgi:hypothetical protein